MSKPGLRQSLVAMVLVFFSYLFFCELFFMTHAMNGIFRPLSSLVLIPAVTADGESVSYREVIELAHGMEGFAGVTDKQQAFAQALSVSVDRLYVNSLAKEHGVTVSADELSDFSVDPKVIASGLETSGWSQKDYEKFLIKPLLLAQQTEVVVENDDQYQTEALNLMDTYRKKLAQGMPFADAAENFSEDSSALARGDLGLMSVGTLPAWLAPATQLEVGEISRVLSAPDAYWTVTLLEYYPSDVPDNAAIHFRGLAVKKKSFGVIVSSAMSTHPPMVFVW